MLVDPLFTLRVPMLSLLVHFAPSRPLSMTHSHINLARIDTCPIRHHSERHILNLPLRASGKHPPLNTLVAKCRRGALCNSVILSHGSSESTRDVGIAVADGTDFRGSPDAAISLGLLLTILLMAQL